MVGTVPSIAAIAAVCDLHCLISNIAKFPREHVIDDATASSCSCRATDTTELQIFPATFYIQVATERPARERGHDAVIASIVCIEVSGQKDWKVLFLERFYCCDEIRHMGDVGFSTGGVF